eukprot:IDg14448t1
MDWRQHAASTHAESKSAASIRQPYRREWRHPSPHLIQAASAIHICGFIPEIGRGALEKQAQGLTGKVWQHDKEIGKGVNHTARVFIPLPRAQFAHAATFVTGA